MDTANSDTNIVTPTIHPAILPPLFTNTVVDTVVNAVVMVVVSEKQKYYKHKVINTCIKYGTVVVLWNKKLDL